jgi:hypothetical protein
LFTLARLYEAEERDTDALRTYSQGLALDPNNIQARNNYEKLAIKTALAQGKPVILPLGADQQVEIDPHSATSYYQLGLRYLRNDEAEAAVVALQQAITLQPSADGAHLFLGLAYTALGAHARAEGETVHAWLGTLAGLGDRLNGLDLQPEDTVVVPPLGIRAAVVPALNTAPSGTSPAPVTQLGVVKIRQGLSHRSLVFDLGDLDARRTQVEQVADEVCMARMLDTALQAGQAKIDA